MTIEELLQPISGSAPCGEDLSFSSEFDEIAELRREDDPTLNQGAWVAPLKSADWAQARARCAELLTTRSKDLRLAMWWAEAATLTGGYEGLQQGIGLCAELSRRYWAELHPQPEDGDMEQRIGNIGWFLNRVVALSVAAPVTRGRGGSYTLGQLQAARALQATLDKSPDKAAVPAETLTVDKFNRALRDTPKDELRATLDRLQGCIESLAGWQAVVDAQLGVDGPNFVPAREALTAAHHEVQRMAREAGALATPATPSAKDAAGAAAAAGTPSPAGGPLKTREQALAQLREVAAFFRTTEPHSPVAYLADKAVRWGDMPLHQWLRTVVKDPGSLSHLEELLGLEAEPREGGAG